MKIRSLLIYAALGSLGLGMIPAGRAIAQTVTTPISNFSQPVNNAPPVSGAGLQAISFTTQGSASYLMGVSALLFGPPPGSLGTAGPFMMSLYGDASGSPGTSLAILSGASYPTNSGIYTFTNTAPVLLAAGTTYWLVAASPASTLDNYYAWADTYSAGLDAGSVWTLGVTKYFDGSSWVLNPGAYLQFSVTVATTNLPALSIYQPVVLTFAANPAVPLVLEQNSDLATTNWVAATNAIQMATVGGGQTVFMVPPSGRQLFFRLSLR